MKMKKLIYSATIVSTLLLVACEDTTEENVGNSVEEGVTEETSADVESEGGTEETPVNVESEDAEDAPNGINQVVSDDENVKATIIKMTKVTDDSGRNAYEILFEVENRRTDQIDVGYTDISGDGRPLSKGQSGMSATLIDPGATGHATLSIYEDEEHGLPENLTMALSISKVNPDTPGVLEYVKDYPLNVTLPVVESPDVEDLTTKEINQVVSDNDNAKITLINMTKVTDVSQGNVYEILFEIENRLTDTMDVGHSNISANGQPLSHDQSVTTISYKGINPETTGYFTLSIYADKEPKLPELNSLVMNLDISKKTGSSYQFIEEYLIDVTF